MRAVFGFSTMNSMPGRRDVSSMDLTKLSTQLDEARKIAAPRTAILWGREDLLGNAIESYLGTAKNWRVIKVCDRQDYNRLLREVEKNAPSIVIVHQSDYAEDFPLLVHLVQEIPDLKVIIVNSENNMVEVYNKQQILIKKATDLLSIIDEHHTSAQGGGEL